MSTADDDLDALLRRADPARLDEAGAAPHLAALATRVSATRRRRLTPLAGVGILIFGTIGLAAAADLVGSSLQRPPYTGLAEGARRTVEPIPLVYTTDEGRTVTCGVWVDLIGVGDADMDRLDQAIGTHDWARFGQAAYDAATPHLVQPDDLLSPVDDRIIDAVNVEVTEFVGRHVDGLPEPGEEPPTYGASDPVPDRRIDSLSISCLPGVLE